MSSRKQGRKPDSSVFGTKQIAIEIAIEEPFGMRDDFYVSKDCIEGLYQRIVSKQDSVCAC